MRERLFRWLLAVTPRDFRERFGPEILDTARALDVQRTGGPWRTIRAVADAVVTPISVRADARDDWRRWPPRRFPMDAWMRDIAAAWRGLRREPGFTAFCVVTLALGIGANTAMFGIADRLLLSGPDHIVDPNRVVRVYETTHPQGMREFTTDGFGYVVYDLLNRETHTFDQVATYAINDAVLGAGAEARPVKLGFATASLFPLLGVRPLYGRFFTDAEDAVTGASNVIVLSEGAWRAWLGGTSDMLGRTVTIGDRPYTVVGVAPHGFTGPQFERVDAWLPGTLVGSRVTTDWTTSWNAQWLRIVGRLKTGVTFEQAGQDATGIFGRGYTGDDVAERRARLTVASLRANDSGAESTDLRVLRWLTGVSALVLVIACANIANLLLARGVRRQREVAIRSALGAGRWPLVRMLLTESMLLAMGGAALGVAVAYQIGTAARTVLFASVAWTAPPINLRLLGASFAIAVLTGLVIGIVPAIRSSRANLGDALKTGIREGGGRRSRLRTGLTVAQAALSVVLLVGAGLFVRSLWKAYTLDFGFDPDRVTVVEVSRRSLSQFPAGPARDAERARRNSFYLETAARVRSIPKVENASVAVGMPFGNRFTVRVRAQDADIPHLPGGGPSLSAVSPGYFETMSTPIVRGRTFGPGDHAGTEPVAIVSQLMAEAVWRGADPLGKCLYISSGPPNTVPACTRIVGVAGNTYQSRLREDPVMHYYIPAGQEVGFGGAVLLVRSQVDSTPMAAIRELLTGLDSTVTYVHGETIRAGIDPQMRPWKLGASVFAVSGVLALVVAGIGIYSVMSYLIAGRRREIGVRLALGARAHDIARLVFGGSVLMAVLGIAVGEVIAYWLSDLAAPLLFATSPRDPAVYAGVAALLLVVAVIATLGPARRARRVDAVEALRAE